MGIFPVICVFNRFLFVFFYDSDLMLGIFRVTHNCNVSLGSVSRSQFSVNVLLYVCYFPKSNKKKTEFNKL